MNMAEYIRALETHIGGDFVNMRQRIKNSNNANSYDHPERLLQSGQFSYKI